MGITAIGANNSLYPSSTGGGAYAAVFAAANNLFGATNPLANSNAVGQANGAAAATGFEIPYPFNQLNASALTSLQAWQQGQPFGPPADTTPYWQQQAQATQGPLMGSTVATATLLGSEPSLFEGNSPRNAVMMANTQSAMMPSTFSPQALGQTLGPTGFGQGADPQLQAILAQAFPAAGQVLGTAASNPFAPQALGATAQGANPSAISQLQANTQLLTQQSQLVQQALATQTQQYQQQEAQQQQLMALQQAQLQALQRQQSQTPAPAPAAPDPLPLQTPAAAPPAGKEASSNSGASSPTGPVRQFTALKSPSGNVDKSKVATTQQGLKNLVPFRGKQVPAGEVVETVLKEKLPNLSTKLLNGFLAQMLTESSGNPNLVSSSGCLGLFQMKPSTVEDMLGRAGLVDADIHQTIKSKGLTAALKDPETNVRLYIAYAAWCYDHRLNPTKKSVPEYGKDLSVLTRLETQTINKAGIDGQQRPSSLNEGDTRAFDALMALFNEGPNRKNALSGRSSVGQGREYIEKVNQFEAIVSQALA